MLEKMQRKGTLVHWWREQTGAATVENSMGSPQQTQNGTAFWPSNSLLGIYPEDPESPIP